MGLRWNTYGWVGSLRHARRWTPRCNAWGSQGSAYHIATTQAPGCVEVSDHLVLTLHGRQLLNHVGQMRGETRMGPRGPEMLHHLPRLDDKRGQLRSCAMAQAFLLGLAGLHPLRGMLALQKLRTRLSVSADQQAAFW